MKLKLTIAHKYLIFGILFGCCFPVFSVLFDCCYLRQQTFSFSNLGSVFNQNPLHYIIATAPLFLGIAFYIAGRFALRQRNFNHQLRKSNTELVQLNESYNTFNYHVSHDLKTIITNGQSLGLMIRKYAERGDTKKVAELSELLLNSLRSGSDTLQGFMQLHKITNLSTTGSDASTTAVLPVLAEVEQQFTPTHSLQVTVTATEFDELPLQVAELRTVLHNLISNSVKYGSATPVVHVALLLRNGQKVIRYSDNGPGIDMEKHGALLFQPFTRFHNVQRADSSGLGLYLIKRILSNHAATIELKSAPGKGVEFTLVFPN